MNDQEAPRCTQGHLSIQQVGTETLVYDERRHKAFCLNRVSSVIWRLANGERTVAQIGAEAVLKLKAPITQGVVLFALDELRQQGLIEHSVSTAAASNVSRRIALQRLGVGAALMLPLVAAIVAPTAAQAYSGCVDCTPDTQGLRSRKQQQNAAPPPSSPGGSQ
jgi:hypothetical protein